MPLVRGTRLVPLEEVTLASVTRLQKLLGDYLVRSIRADGRMVYGWYHPSRGSEDRTRNNSIRQWMATRSPHPESRQRHQDPDELLRTIRRNIDYNLATMYAEEGEVGLILEKDKVKSWAPSPWPHWRRSPSRAVRGRVHATVRDRLATTVDLLWRQDGSFHAPSTDRPGA